MYKTDLVIGCIYMMLNLLYGFHHNELFTVIVILFIHIDVIVLAWLEWMLLGCWVENSKNVLNGINKNVWPGDVRKIFYKL